MRSILVYLLFALIMFSCGSPATKDANPVSLAKKEYTENPSQEAANKYLKALTSYTQTLADFNEAEVYLKDGIKIAKEQNMDNMAGSLTSSYLKQFPKSDMIKEYANDLIGMMNKKGNATAAQSLMTAYTYRFPNEPETESYKNTLGTVLPPNEFLIEKGKLIFDAENPNKLSKTGAFNYVDATEALVMMNPDIPDASKHLTKAAEVAKATQTYTKALAIYDWILRAYPTSTEAPMAQFFKALVLEDNLNNIDEARKNYNLFITNYPDHSFVDDAKFSLETLGLTDTELQQYLEELRNKNEQSKEAN